MWETWPPPGRAVADDRAAGLRTGDRPVPAEDGDVSSFVSPSATTK